MLTKVNILFYLKKSKSGDNGKTAPIYCRITIAKKRTEISTGHKAEVKDWDAKKHRLKTNKVSHKLINASLEQLYGEIWSNALKTGLENSVVSGNSLKTKLKGEVINEKSLLEFLNLQLQKTKSQVNNSISEGTYKTLLSTFNHLKSYINQHFNKIDVPLKEVKYSLIDGLFHYIRNDKKVGNNSALKYLKTLKSHLKEARALGFMEHDPFLNFKPKYRPVNRCFLSDSEIICLQNKDFGNLRLNRIRDIFLFQCFTGLAYIDVKELKWSNIEYLSSDNVWIKTKRAKTNTPVNVPLNKFAREILNCNKKENIPLKEDRVFCVLTNQKMNAYLKEIGDICKIEKKLTCHLARHTFATTITLEKGISIEAVSKMLGHKDIGTTQIYAKMLDTRVAKEMQLILD